MQGKKTIMKKDTKDDIYNTHLKIKIYPNKIDMILTRRNEKEKDLKQK